jgi:hypothetical protein
MGKSLSNILALVQLSLEIEHDTKKEYDPKNWQMQLQHLCDETLGYLWREQPDLVTFLHSGSRLQFGSGRPET